MRRPLVPLALALALATGAVLAELRPVVFDPSGPAAGNTATVQHFYAAANRALLTGDVAPLDAVLAPDFVEHAALPGQSGDRVGLDGYLRALHRSTPTLALTGFDLVAAGDRVAARVEVARGDGEPGSGLPPMTGRAWGGFDLFRLRAGRIAEHWGDDRGLAIAEPLLAAAVPVAEPVAKWVEAGRLTYPSGAADRRWTSGPTLLRVETGNVTVAPDPVLTAGALVTTAAGEQHAPAPGETIALGAGDALVLAGGSFFAARNDGPASASVLVLWSGDPNFARHVTPVAAAGTPAPVATYAALTGGMVAEFPAERVAIAIARVAVAPGAAVARHRVASAEVVVVEAGRLALTVAGGQAWLRTGPDGAPRAVSGGTVATGAGLLVDAGATVGFAPDGDAPLVALVISLGPAH